MKTNRLKRIAHELVTRSVTHGRSKASARSMTFPSITSVGSERSALQSVERYLEFRHCYHLAIDGPYCDQSILEFLEVRSEEVLQKQLDVERNFLSVVFQKKLPRVASERQVVLASRSIPFDAIQEAINHQNPANGFSTALAQDAGLRANALAGLRPIDAVPLSQHRQWDPRLFLGREHYIKYVVERDKGGLTHPIAIHPLLSAELESRRLEKPRFIVDRGVHRTQWYEIGCGHNWSESFSSAIQRATGSREGAHGVRHNYAQTRFNEIRKCGLSKSDSLKIVSEELGHFRPEITLYYFR